MVDKEAPKKLRSLEVYWTIVSYRAVAILVLVLLALGLGVYSLLRPGVLQATLTRVANFIASGDKPGTGTQAARPAQARFVNLDGEVRVRKANAVQWVNADYRLPLDEGDIVQTGTNGVARVTFVDGTAYVVKPETLIVIERNLSLENRATQVAVHITSGAVDLSTGSWQVAGSSSVVSFENLVARMQQNTRAAVKNDPKANVHEITVSEGQAQVEKGSQQLALGPYERASFAGADGALQTEKVIRPPKLARPRNLEPIISRNPKEETIRFEWSSVPEALSYRLRIYTSPLLTRQVLERKNIAATSFEAHGMNPGEYWWNVTAIDAQKQESAESETNKFSLHEQPAEEELLLVIDNVIQHGRVIEIVGRTEPGATVLIQGEQVALVGPDGRFKHFTRPLSGAGAHVITITAQNQRGEVVTRRKPVYVQ
ncbi:MAG: hypothetical protein HY653_09080 [Acidobacteria bacterium]|nr:hypothetical protein [Acidobacteriota bacterium]